MPLTTLNGSVPWPAPYATPTVGGGGAWFGRRWFPGRWFAPRWWGTGGAVTPPFIPTISLREAVVAALKADAGISALVAGRVYPGVVPEGATLPALAWQVISISRRPNRTLSLKPNTITPARFQFSVVSKNLGDSVAVSEAVRQALDAFVGQLANGAPAVVETVLLDERDLNEYPDDGTGRTVYRTVLDYLLRYRESPPARLR